MIHNEALLRAIAARPKDDAVRLVYADWLDEHGESEYAEFIRVQIALHRNSDAKGAESPAELARLRSQERRLLSRHRTRWLQPFRELGAHGRVHGEFSRGFVEEPVIDAAVFLERGAELFQLSPVETLYLNNVGALADPLRRCPHLAPLRRLAFEGAKAIAPRDLRTVLESEHLAHLESLYLWEIPLQDADLLDLAAASTLPALRRLTFSEMRLTGASMPALLARFPELEELGISYHREFAAPCFGDILAVLNPATLRVLSCDQTRLETAGMEALALAKKFTGLEELWLRGCAFTGEALQAFAAATHLTRVRLLYLGWDRISPEGVRALASWSGQRTLESLHLDGCGIGAEGAAALAEGRFEALTELLLRGNGIGDEGAQALAAGAWLARLHTLDVSRNGISAAGLRPLARSLPWSNLRSLSLDENQLGDEGAALLLQGPPLHSLRWLTLSENDVSQETSRSLVAHFPNLSVFSAGSFLSGENLDALREGLAAGGSEEAVNTAIEARLVQAMLDDPDDMEARELYATFLHETGSPWYVVIRLQRPEAEAHFMAEAVERWRTWFATYRDDLLAPLTSWTQLFDDRESFDRGFLRKVHFPKLLPDEAAQTLARFPGLALLPLEVQRGVMTGIGAFQLFALRSGLAPMTRLDFRAINARELSLVLQAPHLTALEELSFGHCGLEEAAAHVLAASAKMTRLRALDFGRGNRPTDAAPNRIGPDGLRALGASQHLAGLRFLGLQGCPVGAVGIDVLLAAPVLDHLTGLDLRATGLGAAEVQRLAAAPRLAALRTLRIGGTDVLDTDAVRALAQSQPLRHLQELEASLSDEGASILAASPHFSDLRTLHVSGSVTDAGMAALRNRFGECLVSV